MSFCLKGLFGLFILLSLIVSCVKPNSDFSSGTGNLPSYYIKINEGNFSPADLRVSAGATVIFVNKSGKTQTIKSTENPSIINTSIESEKTFSFKSDTAIIIRYSLVENPNLQGLLVFRP